MPRQTARREQVAAAATDYVLEHGLVGLSLRPLAAQLGTSDRMLLYHFDGKDDPNIALIRVHPEKGEYWDSPSSTLLHIYGYAKAALTGSSPTEMTDQKKVNLR